MFRRKRVHFRAEHRILRRPYPSTRRGQPRTWTSGTSPHVYGDANDSGHTCCNGSRHTVPHTVSHCCSNSHDCHRTGFKSISGWEIRVRNSRSPSHTSTDAPAHTNNGGRIDTDGDAISHRSGDANSYADHSTNPNRNGRTNSDGYA